MNVVQEVNGVFNNEAVREMLVKWRAVIVVGMAVLILPFVEREWFLAAFVVSMFGEVGQLWCFASLDKNRDLAANGPYSLVRNPMYLARYFIVLGFFLLLGEVGVWLIMPYTLIYGFYMVNRIRREEWLLQSVFGEAFSAYCARKNRILPSFRGASADTLFYWRSDLFRKNNGPRNLVGLLGGYAAIYLASGWVQ